MINWDGNTAFVNTKSRKFCTDAESLISLNEVNAQARTCTSHLDEQRQGDT